MHLRVALTVVFGCLVGWSAAESITPPNVVVIFIDDMGYADIGPFGCEAYPTPNLDRMAAEGRRFTDFHAATAVCSASRAALLTGCYPERVSVLGALFPGDRTGLNPEEVTIAELCRSRGYATGCVGKWHLGDLPEFLPTQHGFDEWFGLPYSNDMWRYRDGETTTENGAKTHRGEAYPGLPLYDTDRQHPTRIADPDVTPEDQAELTVQYTERAVDFIDRHAGERPFFLYLPHTMVHIPLFVSERFAGKSGAGLYGDVVMELDWSVGRVMEALERGGVADNTLVVFTSDNGPWLNFGTHSGSAGPLREGKGTMWEGGYRVPCVMRWPDRVPAGTESDALATTMDLLPTIAGMIGAEPPSDRTIDGRDILPLLIGDAPTPHEVFFCYYGRELHAVRDPRWKLVLPHRYRSLNGRGGGRAGKPVRYEQNRVTEIELYDLRADVGETTNVAADHPDTVARLLGHVEAARAELGDKLTQRKGAGVRPAGFIRRPAADDSSQ